MIEEYIEELTKMLIKQDLEDKENGTKIVKIPLINIIRENIKLLKMIKK